MNYVKVFTAVEILDAEKTFNDFLRETEEKGHRIMHTCYKIHPTWVQAIFTINDTPHPHANRR